uniref:tRNA (adenine(58)-N(1))-methyltransferase non-catalytic subunit TRM6 n=1 Tax=Guillardia theta (strain CCMP2712) TaxID=905079 RepID=A0A0C3U3Q4_GUITC
MMVERPRPGEKIKIARANIRHEDLIGFPYGTVFEVNKGERSALLEEILASGNPGSSINEVSKDRDNRVLLDKNALTNGKESSQKLGADQIKELKNSGMNGREVIKSLIENSDTFKHKTEFSQAKWLKKKAAKHSPQFVTIKPTSLTLCQAYFMKCAGKINYMREDTLGRILTMSNVQPGSRALVVDSGCGLVLGAVAERMGGYGRIFHGFNGLQPSVDAVRWMNLDKDAIASIVQFPLSEL